MFESNNTPKGVIAVAGGLIGVILAVSFGFYLVASALS